MWCSPPWVLFFLWNESMIFRHTLQSLAKLNSCTSERSQSTTASKTGPPNLFLTFSTSLPSQSVDFANGKLQSLSQTRGQKKNKNNFKITKKREFTTSLILNIFLQLYYAGFPRGLQTNLYKQIISSTIELQPLLTEICLPEFSNTIQQSGHEKLHPVDIMEGVWEANSKYYTGVGPGCSW